MLTKGGSPNLITSLTTFTVSSLWHGFIARYFFFFSVAFLYLEASRATMQCGYYFRWVPHIVKVVLGFTITQLFASYTTCNYILTYAKEIHEFNKDIFYWPAILFSLQFVIAHIIEPYAKKAERAETKKLEEGKKNK
jgi:hypothetical protein